MAGKQSALLLAIVVIAGISGMCSAVDHIVGGNVGWTIPTSNSVYSNWARGQTFSVDDVLVFNFVNGTHTVAEVSNADFNGCSASRPIGSIHRTGPTNITLTRAGTHNFICTISGHCTAGQRLSITVTGPSAAAPTTSPSAAPTPSGSAATPPVGASSPSGTPTTVPAASTPTGAEGPAGSSPPGNFAASTGVSLLSLASVAVAALMF